MISLEKLLIKMRQNAGFLPLASTTLLNVKYLPGVFAQMDSQNK